MVKSHKKDKNILACLPFVLVVFLFFFLLKANKILISRLNYKIIQSTCYTFPLKVSVLFLLTSEEIKMKEFLFKANISLASGTHMQLCVSFQVRLV